MNVSLGKHLERYIAEQISDGPFNNASEVVRDALRLHEERQLKLKVLREEIAKGDRAVAEGRVRKVTPEDIIRRAEARTGD